MVSLCVLGSLKTRLLGFKGKHSESEKDRERTSGSCIAFSDLALEVTQSQFCCILFIKVVPKSHPNSREEKETMSLTGE